MNANMESLLVGYEDPRMEKYFDKATGSDATSLIDYKGTYKGIRQGTGFSHKNYNGHSKSTITQQTDAVLMTPAEVWLSLIHIFINSQVIFLWTISIKVILSF